MKTTLAFAATVGFVLCTAAPASAHFKLHRPVDWLVTDDGGDPAGSEGTQKMNPCGMGTPSGIHTKVRAGSTLHVRLTETVPHGGHYRIALVPKLDPVSSDIPEPEITLDQGGECATAKVETPVFLPVLADNLFPHTQDTAVAGQVWETDVTVPSQTGDATLQVIEFMTPHAPQCFYHHCARLEIVEASATEIPDTGILVGPDGGVVTLPDDQDPASSLGSFPATPAGGGGGTSGSTSPTSGTPLKSTATNDGCNVGGGGPSLVTMAGIGFLALSRLRRRRPR